MEATINTNGVYESKLNGKLQSFPTYNELTKQIVYNPAYIDGYVNKWYNEGKLHSYNDNPGYHNTLLDVKRYYINGQLDREGDFPTIVSHNEDLGGWNFIFYKNGKEHRDGDKPSTLLPNGIKIYCKHGKIHRDDDKPAVVNSDGSLEYYKHGVKYSPNLNKVIPYNCMLLKSHTIITKQPNTNTEVKSHFELTTEDTIKYLLTTIDLEVNLKRELVNMVFKDNNINTTQEVIKFFLSCKELNEKEKQEILRLTIQKNK